MIVGSVDICQDFYASISDWGLSDEKREGMGFGNQNKLNALSYIQLIQMLVNAHGTFST